MIAIDLTGVSELLVQLQARRGQLIEALERKMNVLNTRLQQRIQNEKLSGQVLQQRTGKLKRSIEVIPATTDLASGTITGGVQGAGGPAFYGRFHEFGTENYYPIVPVSKQALKFMIGDRTIFAKRVNHPPIQERSFMRSAQQDMVEDFREGLSETIYKVYSAKP